jgi:hypothetical protein
MDADRRIVGVDALISFPLCPLTNPQSVAYEKMPEAVAAGSGVAAIRSKSGGTSGRNHFAPLELWGLCEKRKCRVESIDIEGRC